MTLVAFVLMAPASVRAQVSDGPVGPVQTPWPSTTQVGPVVVVEASATITWSDDSRLQPAGVEVGPGFEPVGVQEAPRRSSRHSEVFVVAVAGSTIGLLGGAWVGANTLGGYHSGTPWGAIIMSSLVGGSIGAATFGALASKQPFGHGLGGAVIGTFLGFGTAHIGGSVADLPGVVLGMAFGQALGAAAALGESREHTP